MIDEPGVADGEIIEEMKSLELMISFHKKARLRNLNPSLFRPDAIAGLIDYNLATGLWGTDDYDAIRIAYASAWVSYYTVRFSTELYYTDHQFASFFKID